MDKRWDTTPYGWVALQLGRGARGLYRAASNSGSRVGPGGIGRSDYNPDGSLRRRGSPALQNAAYRSRLPRVRAMRLASAAYGQQPSGQPVTAPGANGVLGGLSALPAYGGPSAGAPASQPSAGPSAPMGPGSGPASPGAAPAAVPAAAPVMDPYDLAGQQAIGRVNGVYGDAAQRFQALRDQGAAALRQQQDNSNAALMTRYADLKKTVDAGSADMAGQGFATAAAPQAQAGALQLEALQNAGTAQQQYLDRLRAMSQTAATDRLSGMDQARSAFQSGILGDVAKAKLDAAAAAAAASSGGGGGGRRGGGGSSGMSLTSAWPLAVKMWQAQNPQDPTVGYKNLVTSAAFNKKTQPRLWNLQKQLNNHANPIGLLAALRRGKNGKKNGRQAAFLESLQQPYIQAQAGAGKASQGPSYEDLAPYLQLLMGG